MSENPKCSSCKHWTKDASSWRTQAPELGECSRAMPLWEATTWADIDADYRRVLKPEFADRKFFAQDGSDYVAIVLTAPDFFCAEFTDKST